MQRFGPPPSYPTLRIPGLNAPIPEGYVHLLFFSDADRYEISSAQWGFHPGGWGKPPLDEYNRPLYGDVFGVLPKGNDQNVSSRVITGLHSLTSHIWDRLGSQSIRNFGESCNPRKVCSHLICFLLVFVTIVPAEEEEDESEEEEEEEEAPEPTPADGLQTPSGMETPSGLASIVSTVPGGLETPDFLELRKNAGRASSEVTEQSGPRSLYHVVPERQTSVRGLMGSERGYDVSAVAGAPVPVLGEERGTKVGEH